MTKTIYKAEMSFSAIAAFCCIVALIASPSTLGMSIYGTLACCWIMCVQQSWESLKQSTCTTDFRKRWESLCDKIELDIDRAIQKDSTK